MSYDKLQPNDAMYEAVLEMKLRNYADVCDSRDHNEVEGCSNPACFKYHGCTCGALARRNEIAMKGIEATLPFCRCR